MRVSELLELLSEADPDAYVVIRTANYMHTRIALASMDRREVIITAQ